MIDKAKNVDDGGSAFPDGFSRGMNLREWFAGMALQVITKNISLDDFERIKPQELADGAFKISDAMIERRKNERG